MKNAVSDQTESRLNHFRQSTQKDEQRSSYREEEGENRTEGHGDRWTLVLTELNKRQAEGQAFGTSLFSNKLYRGNTQKFIMSLIVHNLL